MASSNELTLTLFGPPTLRRGGEVVRIRRRKSMAILAYLAMTEHPSARDRLAALFWPEQDTQHAMGSLRLALHEVSRAAGVLHIDRERVSFRHNRCRVDAVELCRGVTAAEATVREGVPPDDSAIEATRRTADLYADAFLSGLGLKDAPEFDDWLFFTAEALQARLATLLRILVAQLTPLDTTTAIEYAQRLVRIEPLDEDHHRALIDLYVTEGRYSAAIRQFERCRDALAHELGESPSSDLRKLYEALTGRESEHGHADESGTDRVAPKVARPGMIAPPGPVPSPAARASRSPAKAGTVERATRRPVARRRLRRVAIVATVVVVLAAGAVYSVRRAARAPGVTTLVVAPFDYVAPAGGEARPLVAETAGRFIEGELARESGLLVRRVATGDAASGGGALTIGRRESTTYALEGTVVDDGAELVVGVTLFDVSSGAAVYSDTFFASEADFTAYLTVIAQEARATIYEAVGPKLASYMSSPEALLNPYCETAYLLHPYHLERRMPAVDRSRLYETIMENLDDPHTCQGYFENADTFWNAALFGVLPPPGAGRLLDAAIERGGSELDGPYRDLAVGIHRLVYRGELEEAATHFWRAYDGDPTGIGPMRWWAISAALLGEIDEALAVVEEMALLYPLDPTVPIVRSLVLFGAGRYEQALVAAERAIAANDLPVGMVLKGMALVRQGRLEEAIAVLEEARADPAVIGHATAYLACAYASAGRRREARSLLAELANQPNDDPGDHLPVALTALIHLGLGEEERAEAAIARAVDECDPVVWFVLMDPAVDRIVAQVAETAQRDGEL